MCTSATLCKDDDAAVDGAAADIGGPLESHADKEGLNTAPLAAWRGLAPAPDSGARFVSSSAILHHYVR